jgi:hypothetical protein
MHHAMEAYKDMNLTIERQMELSRQLPHFSPGKHVSIPIEQLSSWDPEPVWVWWRENIVTQESNRRPHYLLGSYYLYIKININLFFIGYEKKPSINFRESC